MFKEDSDTGRQVALIIADKLNVGLDRISPDARLKEDLGLDSFTAVELTFELKDKFGIEIPQQEFIRIKKVGDISGYILACLKKRDGRMNNNQTPNPNNQINSNTQ
jgi:acyl carrier protein